MAFMTILIKSTNPFFILCHVEVCALNSKSLLAHKRPLTSFIWNFELSHGFPLADGADH